MIEKLATSQSMGSGWKLRNVICLELHTVIYNPLKGSSYIPLPKELATKKAIINVKNNDNRCFVWCVLRFLNPVDRDSERIDSELMDKIDIVNMEGIDYPVSFKQIDRFERQNESISITVLGYNDKGV